MQALSQTIYWVQRTMTLALSSFSYLRSGAWMQYERFTAKQNASWQDNLRCFAANRINDLVSFDLFSKKRSLISRITPLAYAALLWKVYPVAPWCTSAVAIGSIALKILAPCVAAPSKNVGAYRAQKNGQEGSQVRGKTIGKRSALISGQTTAIELLVSLCEGNKDVARGILDFLTYRKIGPMHEHFSQKTLFFYKQQITDEQIRRFSRHVKETFKEVYKVVFDDCDVGDIKQWNEVNGCLGIRFCHWKIAFNHCDLSGICWEQLATWCMSLEINDCFRFSDFQWKSLKKCPFLFGLKLPKANLSQVQWHHLPQSLLHLSLAGCKMGSVDWQAIGQTQVTLLDLSDCLEVEKMKWKDFPKCTTGLNLSGWSLDHVNWEALGKLKLNTLVLGKCDLMQIKWSYLKHLHTLILSQEYFPLIDSELCSFPEFLVNISDDKGNLRYTRSDQDRTFTTVLEAKQYSILLV